MSGPATYGRSAEQGLSAPAQASGTFAIGGELRVVVLPIPGTGSLEHLRENVGAALIDLSENDLLAL